VNHSTGKPTRYEQERIEAMRKLGCVACAVFDIPNINELELHHILSGGMRISHWYTIFLCRGHHQGVWNEMHFELFKREHLVAISDGRKLFTSVYPTERELWTRVQRRLKLPAVWPTSKRVPRRDYGSLRIVRPADSAGSPGVLESDYHHALHSGDGGLVGPDSGVLEAQWEADELHGLVQPGMKR